MKYKTILYSLMIFIVFSLGCASEYPKANKDDLLKEHKNLDKQMGKQEDNNRSSADTLPPYAFEYTPLTFQKLQNIRNGSDNFNQIEIVYSSRTNPGQNGPTQIKKLYLTAGEPLNTFDYTMINEYKGGYVHIDRTIPLTTDYHRTFSKSEVDSILDYIENNSVYFFNHDEFNGEESFLSTGYHICHGVYMFSISIVKPEFLSGSWQEQYFPAWGISKCADEYPGGPDDPLYGLFERLEDDFISQFE